MCGVQLCGWRAPPMVHVTIAAEHPHAHQVRMFADCLPTHVSAAALKLSANGFFPGNRFDAKGLGSRDGINLSLPSDS